MFASLHTAQLATRRVQSSNFGGTFVTRLFAAQALRKQRRALAQLEDSQLADIGLTRAQAMHEASRSAWDVPSTWRR